MMGPAGSGSGRRKAVAARVLQMKYPSIDELPVQEEAAVGRLKPERAVGDAPLGGGEDEAAGAVCGEDAG